MMRFVDNLTSPRKIRGKRGKMNTRWTVRVITKNKFEIGGLFWPDGPTNAFFSVHAIDVASKMDLNWNRKIPIRLLPRKNYRSLAVAVRKTIESFGGEVKQIKGVPNERMIIHGYDIIKMKGTKFVKIITNNGFVIDGYKQDSFTIIEVRGFRDQPVFSFQQCQQIAEAVGLYFEITDAWTK